MSEYPNSGSLSKNDRKEKPNHPDVKGLLKNLDEEAIRLIQQLGMIALTGWTKEGRNGKFISLNIDINYMRYKAGEGAQSGGAPAPDDEIPF